MRRMIFLPLLGRFQCAFPPGLSGPSIPPCGGAVILIAERKLPDGSAVGKLLQHGRSLEFRQDQGLLSGGSVAAQMHFIPGHLAVFHPEGGGRMTIDQDRRAVKNIAEGHVPGPAVLLFC